MKSISLDKAFGASTTVSVGGKQFTLRPLTPADRVALIDWLSQQARDLIVGNVKNSMLAQAPEHFKASILSDVAFRQVPFNQALVSEKGRYYILYLSCMRSCDFQARSELSFEKFLEQLEGTYPDELELLCYWAAQRFGPYELEDDHPLVRKSNSSSTMPP